MAKIKYQTNEWGNDNTIHLEIEWNGEIVQITVSDDKITIHSIEGIMAQQEASNYVVIVPDPTYQWKPE